MIELRKAMKSKKPVFRNHNSHKLKRATNSYRKPRGIQNKMRLHHKGYSRVVAQGYRSPAAVRGMHGKGLWPVVVSNTRDLEGLDPAKQGVVFSRTLGAKKRIILSDLTTKAKLTILNIDAAAYRTAVEAQLAKRKAKRQAVKGKQAAAARKAAPKEDKKEDKSKEEEKKELDKVLTKKQ